MTCQDVNLSAEHNGQHVGIGGGGGEEPSASSHTHTHTKSTSWQAEYLSTGEEKASLLKLLTQWLTQAGKGAFTSCSNSVVRCWNAAQRCNPSANSENSHEARNFSLHLWQRKAWHDKRTGCDKANHRIRRSNKLPCLLMQLFDKSPEA
jgi:hypothetical protein